MSTFTDATGKVWTIERPASGGMLLRCDGGIRWVSEPELAKFNHRAFEGLVQHGETLKRVS